MERLHVIFYGKVQGVWFRANCQKKAIELGLTGWVRNLPDRTVEAVIEGEKVVIEEHLEWCKHHQPFAWVDHVDIEWSLYKGEYNHFEIIR